MVELLAQWAVVEGWLKAGKSYWDGAGPDGQVHFLEEGMSDGNGVALASGAI